MIDEKYRDFLVVRPLPEDVELDKFRMPIIKKIEIVGVKTKKIRVTNFNNLNSVLDKNITILDTFNYDAVLKRLWNDPLKYVAKFQGLMAVASPDFSIYPGMNPYEIEHNIFMSRWLGALWQSCGINVIPTISWAGKESYDVCFSGIEKGSIVIISTLGVDKNFDMFISGFNEMKKRIEPSLIIVVGKLYDKMEGDFLHYTLTDTFNQRKKYYQPSLFEFSNYVQRKDGNVYYGW
jgi:hypothetical protein